MISWVNKSNIHRDRHNTKLYDLFLSHIRKLRKFRTRRSPKFLSLWLKITNWKMLTKVTLSVGGCILGLLGLKYGVPNVRYCAQMIYLGFLNGGNKGDVLLSDESEFEFTVSLTDIDFWKHMNNAAYLRYAEAARHIWFWRLTARKNYQDTFKKRGFSITLVAIAVKYRRECKFNHTFILKTKPVYWTQTSIYLRHEFYHKESGLLHCVLYGQVALVQNGRFVKKMENERESGYYLLKWYDDIDDKTGNDYECRNELTEDIKSWIQHLNAKNTTTLTSKL